MIRQFVLSTIALVALTVGVLAPAVSAQTTPVCTQPYDRCVLDYPGGFSLPATPTPAPTSSAVASADDVQATAGSGDNGAIAFTGAESSVLGYIGAGMIGLGAIALVAARRQTDSD